MFNETSIRKFNKKFKTEEDCRQYVFDIKWKKGYTCIKCGHTRFCKGRTSFNARCKKCFYDESVLANTIFHNLKIPLLKAFGMVFAITLNKKGISSAELARQFEVNQKSAWNFKRKLQQVLNIPVSPAVRKKAKSKVLFIDSIILSGKEIGLNGFQQVQLTVHEINKLNSNGKKIYTSELASHDHVKIISNLIKGHFEGHNPNIIMWNFKTWLTGTHHHCSIKFLPGYFNEFLFRFNFRHHRNEIFQEVLTRIVRSNPPVSAACE